MTRRTLAVIVGLGIVAAAGIAVILTLVCTGPGASEQPGTDAGHHIDPIGTEPADVAVAAMSGIFTWQPAVQDSTWDALHSQQHYLSGAMATAAANPPEPPPAPLPDWAAWARGNDTITAVVRPDGDPNISGDIATVPVTIAQTVQHTDGSATPYTTYTATIELHSDLGTWQVARYRLTRASQ
ncbi:hypothetical protein HQ346_16860 [Rhodococcus sp. BP-252]|uniref:hypothetical protein n=1 Tax=unclassified Rhodococcus (in: high G+C Gram-positive bacteria) TaxID=192944 RepID=UPI001C9B1A9C|nr:MULTISPECIES: hypothetical protein [unclassified Rhodococcus (in: high G+C Gram-positive bacteria)]MBY6413367.1 hypothetical protein [Rhodococcus sp. BP-320]MBY6418029.1 hypothetical protein [Rhodococcus sp. BP-321]MBY6422281.1 hypothetical protein [Rhodococcus sp. BP-324]MBY6428078.1 hypothetical protein [Rhodococcus sp. BP-323]MBY6433288.1 hypothetical protein [Rhodococcus sp. BP-322]